MNLEGKKVVVTGGTGSLGTSLVRRIMAGDMGHPAQLTVFSRDEAKQFYMRTEFLETKAPTDAVLYGRLRDTLRFVIGDIRQYNSVRDVVNGADVVFHAAALKQVPTCEYFPFEAVQTNLHGPENVVRACQEASKPPELVVGISTDKACKPINVMGMTKALQERIILQGNLRAKNTRFLCVRYGNVISSRGSAIPYFLEQIARGGPVTITTKDMTRFLLSLDQAVDTVFHAVKHGKPGDTIIPRVPSAKMVDVVDVLIGKRKVATKTIGIRPGEKIHEILVSEEERFRTVHRDGYYAVLPVLPELQPATIAPALKGEFSSRDHCLPKTKLAQVLKAAGYAT